ncbi:hypothetical protein HDV62DRAFT_188148 [Trichoderma sp. SZMC 28011]
MKVALESAVVRFRQLCSPSVSRVLILLVGPSLDQPHSTHGMLTALVKHSAPVHVAIRSSPLGCFSFSLSLSASLPRALPQAPLRSSQLSSRYLGAETKLGACKGNTARSAARHISYGAYGLVPGFTCIVILRRSNSKIHAGSGYADIPERLIMARCHS